MGGGRGGGILGGGTRDARSFQSNLFYFYAVFAKNPNDRRVRVGAARWEIMNPPLTHEIKVTLICDGAVGFFLLRSATGYVIFFYQILAKGPIYTKWKWN